VKLAISLMWQVCTVETRGTLALTTFKASGESGESFWAGANNGEVFFCDTRRLPQDLSPSQDRGGPVSFLELDSFKAVTGSVGSPHVQIWDSHTGEQLHSHTLVDNAEAGSFIALTAMAFSGSALVSAIEGRENSYMECRQVRRGSCASRRGGLHRRWPILGVHCSSTVVCVP